MNISGKFSFEGIGKVLATENEWKTVQSTVHLAFSAIGEILKAQESMIKDMELQVSNKPSRHEVKAEMSDKVTIAELSERLSSYNSIVEAKIIMLEEKASMTDVQKLLSDRVKYDEVKKMLEIKASAKDLNKEMDNVYSQIDKVYKEISTALLSIPQSKDSLIFAELKNRPSFQQLEEALEKKTENLVKTLKQKADKNDLLKKADHADLKSLMTVIENKADLDYVDKMGLKIEKVEKNEGSMRKRTDKQVKDMLEDMSNSIFSEVDERLSKYTREIDKFMNDCNKELRHIRDKPSHTMTDIDYLKGKIKENTEYYERELEVIKESIKDIEMNYRTDLSIEKVNNRDISMHRIEALEDSQKDLEKEIKAIYKEVSSLSTYIPSIRNTEDKLNQLISIKIKDLTNACLANVEDINSVKDQVCRKADSVDVENLIHDKNKLIVANLHEIREELKNKLSNIQTETLKKSIEMFQRIINDRDFDGQLHRKADRKDFEALAKDIDELKSLQHQSSYEIISSQEQIFKDLSQDFAERINSVIVELREKTWTSEIVKLIDSKASIEETNQALVSLHSELDEKISSKDFEIYQKENGIILNTLCAEICVGRWLWTTGGCKDKLIVWDDENTNTNPILFLWEVKKNFILVEEPGIYEIAFGIFSKGTVELMINGNRAVVKNSGDCDSLSKSQFLLLPARARVAIRYLGLGGQGFLSIRKI